MKLGSNRISLELLDPSGECRDSASHSFNIKDFATPKFTVSASVTRKPHYVVGDTVEVGVHAQYYAGGTPWPKQLVPWGASASAVCSPDAAGGAAGHSIAAR